MSKPKKPSADPLTTAADEGVLVLRQLLRDADPKVRSAAAKALAALVPKTRREKPAGPAGKTLAEAGFPPDVTDYEVGIALNRMLLEREMAAWPDWTEQHLEWSFESWYCERRKAGTLPPDRELPPEPEPPAEDAPPLAGPDWLRPRP